MRCHAALLGVLLVAPIGCNCARHVQVDRGGGIVAIPSNSNVWPTNHRDNAEALIRQKCPNGYEIVREEEVVTGQVAHTDTRSQTQQTPTLLLGGSEKESSDKGKRRHSEAFGGLAIPLGEVQQETSQTTRFHDVTEWHIHYRAK